MGDGPVLCSTEFINYHHLEVCLHWRYMYVSINWSYTYHGCTQGEGGIIGFEQPPPPPLSPQREVTIIEFNQFYYEQSILYDAFMLL